VWAELIWQVYAGMYVVEPDNSWVLLLFVDLFSCSFMYTKRTICRHDHGF
jgi:hypothetical protein